MNQDDDLLTCRTHLCPEMHVTAVSAVEPSLEPSFDQCPEAFQFHMVLDKDVERVIKGFSFNKAPGYDRVSARVLKDSLPVILPSITRIMNWKVCKGMENC